MTQVNNQTVIDELLDVLSKEGTQSPKIGELRDKIRDDPKLLEVFTAVVNLRKVYEQNPEPTPQIKIGGNISLAGLFLGIAIGMSVAIPQIVFQQSAETKLLKKTEELQLALAKMEALKAQIDESSIAKLQAQLNSTIRDTLAKSDMSVKLDSQSLKSIKEGIPSTTELRKELVDGLTETIKPLMGTIKPLTYPLIATPKETTLGAPTDEFQKGVIKICVPVKINGNIKIEKETLVKIRSTIATLEKMSSGVKDMTMIRAGDLESLILELNSTYLKGIQSGNKTFITLPKQ